MTEPTLSAAYLWRYCRSNCHIKFFPMLPNRCWAYSSLTSSSQVHWRAKIQ